MAPPGTFFVAQDMNTRSRSLIHSAMRPPNDESSRLLVTLLPHDAKLCQADQSFVMTNRIYCAGCFPRQTGRWGVETLVRCACEGSSQLFSTSTWRTTGGFIEVSDTLYYLMCTMLTFQVLPLFFCWGATVKTEKLRRRFSFIVMTLVWKKRTPPL